MGQSFHPQSPRLRTARLLRSPPPPDRVRALFADWVFDECPVRAATETLSSRQTRSFVSFEMTPVAPNIGYYYGPDLRVLRKPAAGPNPSSLPKPLAGHVAFPGCLEARCT